VAIKRCPVCAVSWEDGQPEKHMMTCVLRSFVPYPGPKSLDCDHEWDFEKDRCVKCGGTWQEVFDI